jgi:hypothetical protein
VTAAPPLATEPIVLWTSIERIMSSQESWLALLGSQEADRYYSAGFGNDALQGLEKAEITVVTALRPIAQLLPAVPVPNLDGVTIVRRV